MSPSPAFADISRLVRPHRVAVVGASDRPGSLRYSTYYNVRNNSVIAGGAVPVNPRYETVLGDRCYPHVSDFSGDPIDVAIVLVTADRVLDVVKDCAASGVRYLVVLSSGFSETGQAGRAQQEQMVRLARASGMRVYGPNSPGLANIADRVLLSMSPVAGADVTSGPVGLVTQGGGLGRALMQWMDRGLGIGLWCSPGNEADLDIADFVNHMVEDDRIRVIGAVVEGFSTGRKFLEVARRAREAGKPIVILKIGRSEYGQKTAASHTASIAGNDAVASAVFAQYGVVRVDDVDELGEALHLFSRALEVAGRDVTRTCVYSFSGGTASLAADLVGSAGLELATFEPATSAALTARAPAFGFVDNPVDLTTKVFTDAELNRAMFELICNDPNVGSVLFAMPADYGENTVAVCRDAVEIAQSTGTLLIPVWMAPHYVSTRPRSYLGWGNSTPLGSSLGLALGAKVAAPDKLSVCFLGDAAFGQCGLELETAVRNKIPVLCVLVNNSEMTGYGDHQRIAEERFGLKALSGRYTEIGAALGAESSRITNPDEVAASIQKGIARVEAGAVVLLEFVTAPLRHRIAAATVFAS